MEERIAAKKESVKKYQQSDSYKEYKKQYNQERYKTIPEITCESCNMVMKKTSWTNHVKTKSHLFNINER